MASCEIKEALSPVIEPLERSRRDKYQAHFSKDKVYHDSVGVGSADDLQLDDVFSFSAVEAIWTLTRRPNFLSPSKVWMLVRIGEENRAVSYGVALDLI